ncbi:hypothetical protein BDZ94DRAFT_1324660 [Collybia nuda]|uniref:DUF6534 domain-containing protein n=1 Tax=Collybia nuda TaxID=64659 RepID=A0A9P5XZR1_9AGAR|nr:hypothetical protein BDZ94DRAFT_1324660 [Collybia nuda]
MANVSSTLGALLVGGLVASSSAIVYLSRQFSGIVTVQTLSYFKYYPSDPSGVKALVACVWILDFGHMIFVGTSLWDYLIAHFGNHARVDFISWSLPLTIAFTATLTFLVHCFYVQRIYKLSDRKLYIAIPLAMIACARLCFATLTTAKMITLGSLEDFVRKYTWSFTSGLALSSLMDVLITAFLCFTLMNGRKKNSNLNPILDLLVRYAFENGALTGAATVLSMIFWLTMPTNLVFMGLHFVISKFYANSLLATLNTRRRLQYSHTSRSQSVSGERPVFPDSPTSKRFSVNVIVLFPQRRDMPTGPLQIKVEESTTRTVDSCGTVSFAPSRPYSAHKC